MTPESREAFTFAPINLTQNARWLTCEGSAGQTRHVPWFSPINPAVMWNLKLAGCAFGV